MSHNHFYSWDDKYMNRCFFMAVWWLRLFVGWLVVELIRGLIGIVSTKLLGWSSFLLHVISFDVTRIILPAIWVCIRENTSLVLAWVIVITRVLWDICGHWIICNRIVFLLVTITTAHLITVLLLILLLILLLAIVIAPDILLWGFVIPCKTQWAITT